MKKSRKEQTELYELGKRHCNKCCTTQNINNFHCEKNKYLKIIYRTECKECRKKRNASEYQLRKVKKTEELSETKPDI